MPILPIKAIGGLVPEGVSVSPPVPEEPSPLADGDWVYGHPPSGKADEAWLAKGGFTPQPLSDRARKLPQSIGFRQLFPNFDVLSKPAQESALRTIQRFVDAFPDFIATLNQVKDPAHGPGYQIYFVPDEPAKSGPLAFLQQQGQMNKGGKHAGIVYSQNQAYFMVRMAAPVIRAAYAPNLGGVRQEPAEELAGRQYYDVLAHELAHLVHDYYLSKGDQAALAKLFQLALKRHGPFDEKPYWTTNPREYFAESVMAYLTDYDRPTPPTLTGKHTFYTRGQLQQFHPEMTRFVGQIFGGRHQKPFRADGGMLSLRVAGIGGQTVGGVGITAEKDLVKGDVARLSLVGTGETMANRQSLVLRGSAGLRTTLGPDPKDGLPIGVYGEGGLSGTLGFVGDRDVSGIGPYAAAGVSVKGANLEFRRDWTPSGSADTASLGYAARF